MKILNLRTKQILVGLLLGDAQEKIIFFSLARSGDKCFITFEQTIKHKDYVLHLYDLLVEAREKKNLFFFSFI